MLRFTSSALQLPMPVSLSGVMFDGRTVYSAVSQTCGPPACSLLLSRTPLGPRGVWQLPHVRIPSTRYLPRSSGDCAHAVPATSAIAAHTHFISLPLF